MTTEIDFNTPVSSQNYLTILATLRLMLGASSSLLDSSEYTVSNTPTGCKRWNASTGSFQNWDGSAWANVDLKAKYDDSGNVISSTYAQASALADYATVATMNTALAGKADTTGTYSGMTVGTASNYASGGNIDTAISGKASTTGNYPNMTVGTASNYAASGTIATALSSKVAVSGSRGSLAGYQTSGSATTINEGSSDCNETSSTSISISAGSSGTSWTKIVRLTSSSTVSFSLGSGWVWVGNSAPTYKQNSILVCCWCGSGGIVNLVLAS